MPCIAIAYLHRAKCRGELTCGKNADSKNAGSLASVDPFVECINKKKSHHLLKAAAPVFMDAYRTGLL
jgi:hypothetical protein